MRLIDGDALLDEIATHEDESDMPELWHNGVAFSKWFIFNAPTIDHVKHGRWVPLYDDVWECSECERAEQFAENIESTSRYCPNCGALMQGGKDETD